METWLFHLDSMDADYANLEQIYAMSNSIHRSTKNLLELGIFRPRKMHRHTYFGGVIASVAPLDLATIPSILVLPAARYHI